MIENCGIHKIDVRTSAKWTSDFPDLLRARSHDSFVGSLDPIYRERLLVESASGQDMILVSRAEGEPMELECTPEWPPDSKVAIQLRERFMSSRIFKRSARAFRAPRIARQRMLPPPEYPPFQIGIELQNLLQGST
jgi:hypothetical protein